jgi:hypothetical protein
MILTDARPGSFCHSSYFIHDCSCVVQRENSADVVISSPHSARMAQKRDNHRLLTVSSIPEEAPSTPFDDKSGWILDPPLFIRTNFNPAPRSLDMDENRLVLLMKPLRAVPQLPPAKTVTPDLPRYGNHCAKEQNSEVAHTSAITDISLVKV